MNGDTLRFLLPEGLVALFATIAALVATLPNYWRLARLLGLVGLIVAAAAVTQGGPGPERSALADPVWGDALAYFGRLTALVFGGIVVLGLTTEAPSRVFGEAVAAALFAVVGLMITCVAGDLVLLFVGLELVSIASYVLLALAGMRSWGLEAAIKYFLLSVVASAVMVYGFSFLYGLLGSTGLEPITVGLGAIAGGNTVLAVLGVVFVLTGLGYKMTAVPFHFYAPDVYQGTSFSNAGVLAVLPKLAGLIAAVRLLLAASVPDSPWVWQLFLALCLISMTLGNVCALWQRNVRRMMAYSSIAHAGYLFIGLTVAAAGRAYDQPLRSSAVEDGTWAVLFYALVYGLATLGIFSGLAYIELRQGKASTLDDVSGAGRRYPAVGAAVAACLFSLAGIPPVAGFLGKFFLFRSVIGMALELPAGAPLTVWMWVLAVAGIANAAVAAAYYLRLVGALYFAPPQPDSPAPARSWAGAGALAAALLVVGIGLAPGAASRTSRQAAASVAQRLAVAPAAPSPLRAEAVAGR